MTWIVWAFSLLSSAWSAIKTILGAIPWQVWCAVLLVLLGIYIGSGGCSCRRERRPPRPPVNHTYKVVSVENGATITVKTGRLKRRTASVGLRGIAVDLLSNEARKNLELYAGSTISVERDAVKVSPEEMERTALEGRAIVGIVYGESGVCLQLQQLRDGWAKYDSGPAEWKAAEQEARKANRGQWGP